MIQAVESLPHKGEGPFQLAQSVPRQLMSWRPGDIRSLSSAPIALHTLSRNVLILAPVLSTRQSASLAWWILHFRLCVYEITLNFNFFRSDMKYKTNVTSLRFWTWNDMNIAFSRKLQWGVLVNCLISESRYTPPTKSLWTLAPALNPWEASYW